MQILAEAAGQLPAGTSSGNIMPGLSNLGAGGARHHQHQPHTDDPASSMGAPGPALKLQPVVPTSVSIAPPAPSDDTLWVVRTAQKVAGWAIGLGTAAYLLFYQWVIEPAAPG